MHIRSLPPCILLPPPLSLSLSVPLSPAACPFCILRAVIILPSLSPLFPSGSLHVFSFPTSALCRLLLRHGYTVRFDLSRVILNIADRTMAFQSARNAIDGSSQLFIASRCSIQYNYASPGVEHLPSRKLLAKDAGFSCGCNRREYSRACSKPEGEG